MIQFNLPAPGPARLRIFDVTGREIWNRELTTDASGWQQVGWDGRNRDGGVVASGVYFAHVVQGERYAAIKLILIR